VRDVRVKVRVNKGRVTHKRTVNIPKIKGGTVIMSGKSNMECLAEIKKIIQDSMREKGLTATEARKSLGVKRYEK
jgi:hypothetical protein